MRLFRLAFMIVALSAFPSLAMAHAGLDQSIPSDGETVKAGVSEVKLQFSEAVRVTLLRLTQADDPVEPQSELPTKFVERIMLSVPPLKPGGYKAQWTAVAKDGHVISGTFSFTVAD